jgi:hypothetical protein
LLTIKTSSCGIAPQVRGDVGVGVTSWALFLTSCLSCAKCTVSGIARIRNKKVKIVSGIFIWKGFFEGGAARKGIFSSIPEPEEEGNSFGISTS